MAANLKVKVWRGKEEGEFATYEVPRLESQTVLDVVTYIQRKLEPGLSYRYACRVGMCGSCAMTVNGVARWTCRTHVAKVAANGKLEIAPLSNLPVVKDWSPTCRNSSTSGRARWGISRAARPAMTRFPASSPSPPRAAPWTRASNA